MPLQLSKKEDKMSFIEALNQSVKQSVGELFDTQLNDGQVQLQKTKKEFDGQITLVVFPLLRITKKGPEQSGEAIGEWLVANSAEVSGFNVVKGFLNLELTDKCFAIDFNDTLSTDTYGFVAPETTGKAYMVEYSSPNTNKPLHLGHLRNNFLGYSVAEILKANGHKVIKTQIINDRGIHICKSMLAWQKFGAGETPTSSGMKGDHLIGKYYVKFDQEYKKEIKAAVESGVDQKEAEQTAPILQEAREMLLKWESKDADIFALWENMNSWVYEGFKTTYATMGVDFDSLYYESDTYILGKNVVNDGLEKGVFYKKDDGSVWCGLEEYKMDDKLLLRGDGTSVYMTQDIGTAIERFKDVENLSGLIYTVGNEQDHHFKVLFAILSKLGFDWAKECYHLSYGMVELPEGKMKSREGTVVDADELMQAVANDAGEMTKERAHIQSLSAEEQNELFHTIGMGGLKYYLLKVDPKSKMMFDPKESIDLNGNTGPFIQYTYARIQSILRNAEIDTNTINTDINLEGAEKEMIQHILDYNQVISRAGEEQSPALVANYVYDLVKLYNSFYQSIDILKEENVDLRNFRILLSKKVGQMIKSGMALLGVNVPNQM
ncbi:MAG: arginyl-tRNA synthetase [Flavobacteriales bacterium]